MVVCVCVSDDVRGVREWSNAALLSKPEGRRGTMEGREMTRRRERIKRKEGGTGKNRGQVITFLSSHLISSHPTLTGVITGPNKWTHAVRT